jgi:hypothetical protein
MALDLFMASFEKTGGPPWLARHGLTGSQQQALFDDLSGKGWRQVCLSGYAVGSEPRFASLWHKVDGPAWASRRGLSSAEYQVQVNTWVQQGYRPLWLTGYNVAGQEKIGAIFTKAPSGAWEARHGLTHAQYQATFNDLRAKGYRLRGISPYQSGGQARYMAWWEKAGGPDWQARHGQSEAAFRATHSSLAAQGYDLVCGGACLVGNTDVYAGLWEKRAQASIGHHGQTGGAYQAHVDQAVADGYRLTFVAGYAGALPVDVNLRFRIQRQQQSNWCWSAVSTSIRHYYHPSATLTQCQLVNQRRGRTDCCTAGPGADTDRCNKADTTSDVLSGLGHLAQMQNTFVSFADLRSQLALGRPVFVRIEWDGGGRHAIAAAGTEDGAFVIICDPGSSSAADPSLGTTSVVDYDTLKTSYNGSGEWIGTGYTKA